MNKAFSNLTTVKELQEYLDEPFHYINKTVAHYTSLDSLLYILSDRRLKFSCFEKTNDVIECDFVSEETKKKRFFCMMGSAEENFGMWAMYGGLASKTSETDKLKSTYVKIKIPVSAVKSFIKKNDLRANAVAYTRLLEDKDIKNPLYYFGNRTNRNSINLDKEALSGYVKDVAWKYEREIRIWSESEYVSIDDNFINNLEVFPSPIITYSDCKKLIQSHSRYGKIQNVIEKILKPNKYEGKVQNYKEVPIIPKS